MVAKLRGSTEEKKKKKTYRADRSCIAITVFVQLCLTPAADLISCHNFSETAFLLFCVYHCMCVFVDGFIIWMYVYISILAWTKFFGCWVRDCFNLVSLIVRLRLVPPFHSPPLLSPLSPPPPPRPPQAFLSRNIGCGTFPSFKTDWSFSKDAY